MSISHRNRKGETYHLHVGRTSTGKPKYYFSRKAATETLAEGLPEGYEIYEKPDSAQVYLRKIQRSAVTQAEREFVLAECRRLSKSNAVLVDIEGDDLIVYFSDRPDPPEHPFGNFRLPMFAIETQDRTMTRGVFLKLLRFRLQDPDRRLYSVDRWCFRGSIDNWFPLSCSIPLERAVARYAPHLGRDSYFELM